MSQKNLILDLDETLVHTFSVKLPTGQKGLHLLDTYKQRLYIIDTINVNNKNKLVYEKMWGVTRPGLQEFISFCFDNFTRVIIWSAGTERYVKDTVNRVLCDLRCPDYVFTQLDCKVDENGYISKPIKYLKSNNPELVGLNLENTLLVDDRSSNFQEELQNGIEIPEFNPNKLDRALYELMTWFNTDSFRQSTDVRTLNKSNIFNSKR